MTEHKLGTNEYYLIHQKFGSKFDRFDLRANERRERIFAAWHELRRAARDIDTPLEDFLSYLYNRPSLFTL